jgi:hypothetical protein
MSIVCWPRRRFLNATLGLIAFWMALPADAQEPQRSREPLREPVYRVSKARVEPPQERPVGHPLDPAMKIAQDGLILLRSDVTDYSCMLVKRERVGGVLNDPEYIFTEVRNRKEVNGRAVSPFSVYMYFLKPSKLKGREVIFVEGHNNNKLVAHEGGNFLKLAPPVWLRPGGPIAMRGNLYPITDVGIENLIAKLLERGERDKQRGECEVQFIKEAKVNGRMCTVLQVTHPTPRPYFDFHIARIFIDDEVGLPIRYAAYSWPTTEGGRPQLLEEYTYLNLKLNVGLSDDDFDHRKKFKG